MSSRLEDHVQAALDSAFLQDSNHDTLRQHTYTQSGRVMSKSFGSAAGAKSAPQTRQLHYGAPRDEGDVEHE